MHHDVGDVAVRSSGVWQLAAEEDSGVGVHCGLVSWNRLVKLPQDNALRVIEQVLADTWEVLDDRDTEIR